MSPAPPAAHPATQLSAAQALFRCIHAALGAIGCAGLITAAVLAPAPPAVLPLLVLVSIGVPMTTALELRPAAAALRSRSVRNRAVAALRHDLQQLPETEHPLGL
jgi:hypothetical protein